MSSKTKLIILGAAGRDFHDFNVYWKQRDDVEVVCFTATQIPDIDGRVYPPALAGPKYPNGIPIHAEDELEALIKKHEVDLVSLAYSDISHETAMHLGSRAMAAGAQFCMLGADQVMIKSTKPVIGVCAVRTGCGKSQTTRRVAEILKEQGKRIAVCRHPMPYGDLEKQAVQRFATLEDMDKHECTIEEREEYEPHIVAGNLVFAGVDYESILRQAEKEADVVLWDGGNNDLPFFAPDLLLVVVDPHRAGHEMTFYPGETNLRMADAIVINKMDTANDADVATLKQNIATANPNAVVIPADSPVSVDDPAAVKGKKVLVIEDGPTLTHGQMKFGAGHVAARNCGAAELIDPRPYAQGSIKATFEKYNHLSEILPAMGYGDKQISELEATIDQVPCDVVIVATPIDLGGLLKINKPSVRVRYDLKEHDQAVLPALITKAIGG
ncbi:MAG: GTPase [Planctomycetes bacterium]|nr:GTPase [Planctomycetota bacterium]NOG55967.1 GTPase [Planctomycetota bacterium]